MPRLIYLRKIKRFLVQKKNDAASRMQASRYHRYNTINARNALKSICEDRGKFSNQWKRQCDEYAKEVLGWDGFAPWLYVYTAMNSEFREGWIPENFFDRIVAPKVQGDYGRVSKLKGLTQQQFCSDHFPDLLFCINGRFFDREYALVDDVDVPNILFSAEKRVIFKPDNSMQGIGINIRNDTNFDLRETKMWGNGVFQAYINQHEDFDRFPTGSVATVRLTTVVQDDGNISLRAAFLRLGHKEDTYVKSDTHIRSPIDLSTGRIAETAILRSWKSTSVFPGSNVTFKDFRVPNFSKAVALALKLHQRVPFVECVGWDMVTDHAGDIKVMEWNGDLADVKFCEATQGPCFKDLHWERFGNIDRNLNQFK